MQSYYIEKFIKNLLEAKIKTRPDLFKFQRRFSKEHNLEFLANDEILKHYHRLILEAKKSRSKDFENLFRLKNTRSGSGIVVISVLTKPYFCPGKCIYCPSEKDVPKSYLKDEPAVMRAIACQYHPFKQVETRLKALKATGHITDKISIRIVGGTWSYYTKNYQTWFVKNLFLACNTFDNKVIQNHADIFSLQEDNEKASYRIVELSVETRQDYIDEKEIKRLRVLGVTKVELGVQSIYDDVLKTCKRGNSDDDTKHATKLLKDAGFKVSYQIMLNLPMSDLKRDLKMFETLFSNQKYLPDHLKIYPLAILKNTELYKYYQDKSFKPYNEKELVDLICEIKKYIPYYTRIERVIRDIPAYNIVEGGAKVSNLRQVVEEKMKKENKYCKCIRCREIKSNKVDRDDLKMFREDFQASGGREIFLTIETKDRKHLISMLRLRIPSYVVNGKRHYINALDCSAIIREIHTYGNTVKVGNIEKDLFQHQGYGKFLMKEAEKITKEEYKLEKISVISGVGVRGYFKKLGYALNSTYMVKNLS